MNVIPNMNMQIAHTIRPVMMFLRASRRVIISELAFYRCTLTTIAQNSSAR
jgi:hypothetical protein